MESWPLLVLVDDESEILSAIKRTLMRLDVRVESFTSPRLALDFIQAQQPFMVISDQRMPDIKGMELLAKVKELAPKTKRIMLSAHQDFDIIADGFNQGIIEQFISKPWVNRELQNTVRQSMPSEAPVAKPQHMIGEHESMQTLFAQIGKAAGANVPIFIHGETGAGKELVAKACHQYGAKCEGSFIAVNCANFSEHLMESQLFGHKKGAFTGATNEQKGVFAEANGGTVFLDEITTLSLPLQSKLLRVIQEREYSPLGTTQTYPFDAQIVSASSTSLLDAVGQGEFREDLFYRLNVITLSLPPLSQRGDDVLLLAEHFLNKFSQTLGKAFSGFDAKAKALLLDYRWPGNVRQLENIIHGLCIMNDGPVISAEILAPTLVGQTGLNKPKRGLEEPSLSERKDIGSTHQTINDADSIMPLTEIERIAIEKAITQCDGNVTKAASLLEVNPSTLYRKIKSWQ